MEGQDGVLVEPAERRDTWLDHDGRFWGLARLERMIICAVVVSFSSVCFFFVFFLSS